MTILSYNRKGEISLKQHITPKQAKEITERQFYGLFDEIVQRKDWANYHHKKVTIGKLIEVLGEITIVKQENGWQIYFRHNGRENMSINKELVDLLWDVLKEKLSQ